MTIKITPNDHNNPPGKLADSELHFTDGPLRNKVVALETFREVEDDVDAATPVDAQNAPTEVWESRTEREIPPAPTSIILFADEEEEPRTKPLRSQLSTESDHPQLP
jgi:hypothetical protein